MATDHSSTTPSRHNQEDSAVRYRIVEPAVRCRRPDQWRTYRVGDDGSVWSKSRHGSWKRLKPTADHGGHVRVCLGRGLANKRYVHRLVLEAFIGPRPEGMECCHNDGNPANNVLENLRWGTPVGNQADRIRHGTSNRGSRHGLAKLTSADVLEIVRRRLSGETLKAVGDSYGIHKTTVGDIAAGRRWSWLTKIGSEYEYLVDGSPGHNTDS